MTNISKFLLASVFSITMTASASAQIVVQGGGAARDCYMSTKAGNPGRIGTIKTCRMALTEPLSNKDLAATHVNLGVLLMRKGDYSEAQAHYAQAIEMRPKLAEAYINHAASLIYSSNYQEALNAINMAIELGTDKMPEALYNRAIAHDRLKNYKGAYKDLKQALVLRPDWAPALDLISSYQVASPAKS
ncbi:tetratricopeptide repeat protein [Hellea balneolensis]|uniref:tetratricopeptide repeat protein n=1 Tax=Hellea balneolensis TaxID=287478 RepID=UPI00041C2831|nr:tetratricopeptide repeat protein [Hellea balneolensis]